MPCVFGRKSVGGVGRADHRIAELLVAQDGSRKMGPKNGQEGLTPSEKDGSPSEDERPVVLCVSLCKGFVYII